MKKELNELSDQELLDKRKKIKSTQAMSAVLLGALIGVAVYSTVKNGIGFFALFVLLAVFLIIKNNTSSSKALEKEINARNLNDFFNDRYNRKPR